MYSMLITPFYKRDFQSVFYTPSALQATFKRGPFDTLFLGPLLDSLVFPIMKQKSIFSRVKHLLSSCGPTAIIRLIVAVCVYSINSHVWFRLSKISKEVRKIHPSITYFYTPSAVIFESGVIWVKASLFNSKPYPVKRGIRYPMGLVSFMHYMRSFGGRFISKATARNNIPRLKVISTHIFGIAAITDAQKMNFSFGKISNDKFSETVANSNRIAFFSRHKKRIAYKHIINQGV